MKEDTRRVEAARTRVAYEAPGIENVSVHSGVVYRDAPELTLDVYRPPRLQEDRAPAVVLVAGYPDPGYERIMGCKLKDTGASTSWARLLATSGLVAITYTSSSPAADARALLGFVRDRAELIGIDPSRVGLFACSGNVPLALSLALATAPVDVRCAALYYGYMPDEAESAPLFDAAAKWRFANPFEDRAFEIVRRNVPLFIARGGCDEMPGVNASIDRFTGLALESNLPLTLVNHPEGPHAFDLFHDSDSTRSVVRQTLAFFEVCLGRPAHWEPFETMPS